MSFGIDMGQTPAGMAAILDLEELLATRLLVQGNSGSGKSHLLRRLIEQSAPYVQQAIIDPEGDFVTLAEAFGHVVVDAADHKESVLQNIAARVREHRVSVVLNLENLDAEMQMRMAAAFLGGLFDIDREFWFPMLVVVDEAQLFAPAAAGEVSDEARKASLGAMTNLMCRGRKRGLAGIIATQRLAKLAKNVAAEASNFLMGRTFLDIDMARAADLLGMERRQAEAFRDLQRGQFIALGPALSRRPLQIRIGAVSTSGRGGGPKLTPLPTLGEGARELIFKSDKVAPKYQRQPSAASADLLAQVSQSRPAPAPLPLPAQAESDDDAPCAVPEPEPDLLGEVAPPPAPRPAAKPRERAAGNASFDDVLRDILADPEADFRSVAVLYQDFLVRCRGLGLNGRSLDMPAFRRRLAAVRAGADQAEHPEWDKAADLAARLPEEVQGVFLLLARAALDAAPCPSNVAIARVRGSRSPRRALGLLTHLEQTGVVEIREDFSGYRIVGIPELSCETAPGDPDAPEEDDLDVA